MCSARIRWMNFSRCSDHRSGDEKVMSINTHVLNLCDASADLNGCWRVLSEQERERASRFRKNLHRNRWIIARAGMRRLLSQYTDELPAQLEFTEKEFGKPIFRDEHSARSIHFNLSHSGDLAILAVSHDGPVGIDIEDRRTIPEMERVARHFFSNYENDQLSRMSCQQQLSAFYRCWTRKEAVIKTSGMGLSAQLDAFDVSLSPEAPADVLQGSHGGFEAAHWHLSSINVDERYEVSIASCSGSPVDVKYKGMYRS